MRIDYNAYIGPYLKVKTEIKTQFYDPCENQGHNFLPSMEFCPQCGTSKKNRIREYTGTIAPPDWEEKFSKGLIYDYLHSTSVMGYPPTQEENGKKYRTYIYLPNRYYKELNIPRINDAREECELDFDFALNPTEMKEKFQELFSEEIAYMRQWFEVTVHFGYVSYCS